MRKIYLFLLTTIIVAQQVTAQDEKVDTAMARKIREEGLNRSQVMDIAFYLTDANGPRLMGSPGYMRAANWAKDKLTSWGLQRGALEPWGDWGKSWELQRSYIALSAPYYKPIIAYPKSWCAGTNGLQNAEVIIVDAKDSVELQSFVGKLKGKIIITPRTDTLIPTYKPDAKRLSDEDLEKMAAYEPQNNPSAPRGGRRNIPMQIVNLNKLKKLARAEGAVAILSASPRGRDGTIFVSGGGPYIASAPENLLDMVLSYEDYMLIYRLAEHKIPVKVELDVKAKFNSDDIKGYNVVAEIPGTDKKLKDQIVMIGGHLDSWHAGMGATDNAAGCAVMMEAVRILKTLNVAPKRTIRIALWSGEEQGLHGSRNYVKNHFTDTVSKKGNKESEKISVYFNLDNGSGKIRGVYLQGNANVKPVFSAWLEPFKDLGATTLTLQNTGGTDHLSFDAVNIPAFQFIQDPIEYDTRTHHTNMDTYDHLQPDDLKQAATIIADFIYQAAQRQEMIPRKTVTTVARN